jgi:hypothetical protein
MTVVKKNGKNGKNGKAAATEVVALGRTPLQQEVAAIFDGAWGKEAKLELLMTALECTGIHASVIDAVLYRARSIAGLGVNFKTFNDRELTDELRKKISMATNYLDPVVLAQTGGKDLSIMLGILIEKLQLLEGKPTNILLTREERSHLNELIPVLLQEARHRGIDLGVSAETTDGVYTEIED